MMIVNRKIKKLFLDIMTIAYMMAADYGTGKEIIQNWV